jgi:hypothetical protein
MTATSTRIASSSTAPPTITTEDIDLGKHLLAHHEAERLGGLDDERSPRPLHRKPATENERSPPLQKGYVVTELGTEVARAIWGGRRVGCRDAARATGEAFPVPEDPVREVVQARDVRRES